jgi:hypothetical protein
LFQLALSLDRRRLANFYENVESLPYVESEKFKFLNLEAQQKHSRKFSDISNPELFSHRFLRIFKDFWEFLRISEDILDFLRMLPKFGLLRMSTEYIGVSGSFRNIRIFFAAVRPRLLFSQTE